MNITTKPFLLVFFDSSEKAYFAILFFDLPFFQQAFYRSMYNIIWIMLYMKGSVVAECGQYNDYAYAGGICGSGGNISNSYNNASIEANNTSSKGGSFYEKDA